MKKNQEYCGYITIIGKPNVGKSTLINNIIKEEISITSKKKNTTQKNIFGIKTKKLYQYIYVDTPGINTKKNRKIKKLDHQYKVLKNSVLVILITDRLIWKENDELILNYIKLMNIPIIFVINKIDKISNKNFLLPYINFIKKKINPLEIVPICAKQERDLILLEKIIKNYLPKKDHIFPSNYTTTNSLSFSLSEIIRKKIILFLREDLPLVIKVRIESIKSNNNILHIKSIIYVDNTRQKKIIIGKKGEIIKKISISSRFNIEYFLNKKIYLFIWIKNKKKYT
ncbi:GTPase Era [Buchnera aphidicola (Melanaphis sacchari)]|uniref:GTPase Era n=1 Tax=Buchnera aphidicola (Melanaphis sacchari) TaxID=2173854 RepID=A0A2U8DGC4_9GAMM|nr:GTPase Era [Buchnera aphidicola]AWH90525.1 GTPase Era [Buchnera aphidicola (Melanaphis sacchari)]